MIQKTKNIIKKTFIFDIYKHIVFWYRHLQMFIGNKGIILLYHRINDAIDDPLLLSVSKENFYRQMVFLKKNYNIINLETLVYKIKDGENIRKNVVITFDDGYVDNLYNALPILKELNIPATIFITAGKIDDTEAFVWDKPDKKNDLNRAVTSDELKELSLNHLIEIGAHTISHPHLHLLNKETQKNEIYGSKDIIEKIINKKIKSFSYPFGTDKECNPETIDIVKGVGFQYACSNIKELVNKKSNIYSLPRYLVRNWNIKDFKINI